MDDESQDRLEFLASVAPGPDEGSVVTIIGELEYGATEWWSPALEAEWNRGAGPGESVGFESVTLKLAEDYGRLREICQRHGIQISATRVRKVVKHFAAEKERTRAWRKILEQTTGALLRQSADES